MRIKRLFCLLILLMALFPASLPALEIEGNISKHTLPNGIRVFIYERHAFPTVTFYIGHKVGAVDDEATGAAHFLEHLLFKGTPTIGSLNFPAEEKILKQVINTGEMLDEERAKGKGKNNETLAALEKRLQELSDRHRRYYSVSELARLYIENGATDFNASTGRDLTLYMVSLPRDKLEPWARIEAERRIRPVFREFYAERSVVAQERIQRTDGLPEGRLNELFFATAFTSHPYRNPTIGWMEDITALRYGYMTKYFENFYSPQNTVIVVVGDINATETMAIIAKHFGKIPPRRVVRKNIVAEPPQTGEKRAQLVLDANEKLIIGFHKPTYPHKDDFVFEVIEGVLASGRSSRLHRRLVEGMFPIATEVSAANGNPGIRYSNLFCIYATPLLGRNSARLEEVIYEELEKLKNEGISERELEKVKNRARLNFLSALASNNGLASLLAYHATVFGDLEYIQRYLPGIAGVTSEDVKRVAREYFTTTNRVVVGIKKK